MLKFTVFRPIDKKNELKRYNSMFMQFLHTSELAQDLFMNDDFCKTVVKEIDKSEIWSNDLIVSSILGKISPSSLSSNVSLILSTYFLCKSNYFDFYLNSSYIISKCISYLFKIAVNYDITMWVTYLPDISDSVFKQYFNILYSIEEERYVNSVSDFKEVVQRWTTELIKQTETEERSENTKDKVGIQLLKEQFSRYRNIRDGIPYVFRFSYGGHEYEIPIKYKINNLLVKSDPVVTTIVNVLKDIGESFDLGKVKFNIDTKKIKVNVSLLELYEIIKNKKEYLVILDETNEIARLILCEYVLTNNKRQILSDILSSKSIFLFIMHVDRQYYLLPHDAVISMDMIER